MKKIIILIAFIAILAIALAGCNSQNEAVSSIETALNESGAGLIKAHIDANGEYVYCSRISIKGIPDAMRSDVSITCRIVDSNNEAQLLYTHDDVWTYEVNLLEEYEGCLWYYGFTPEVGKTYTQIVTVTYKNKPLYEAEYEIIGG